MKSRSYLQYGLGFLVAATVASAVAWLVTLVMFSGITGPIGYFAWIIVCFPAQVIGVGGDLLISSVVSGASWGLLGTCLVAQVIRRRRR